MPAERRQDQRYPVNGIRVDIRGTLYEVENINVSGVKVIIDNPELLAVEETVDVYLVEVDQRLPLRGRVAWIDQQRQRVGIHFRWQSESVREMVKKILGEDDPI